MKKETFVETYGLFIIIALFVLLVPISIMRWDGISWPEHGYLFGGFLILWLGLEWWQKLIVWIVNLFKRKKDH